LGGDRFQSKKKVMVFSKGAKIFPRVQKRKKTPVGSYPNCLFLILRRVVPADFFFVAQGVGGNGSGFLSKGFLGGARRPGQPGFQGASGCGRGPHWALPWGAGVWYPAVPQGKKLPKAPKKKKTQRGGGGERRVFAMGYFLTPLVPPFVPKLFRVFRGPTGPPQGNTRAGRGFHFGGHPRLCGRGPRG